jgi:hypothetical protein
MVKVGDCEAEGEGGQQARSTNVGLKSAALTLGSRSRSGGSGRTRSRLSENYIRRICRPKGACRHQPVCGSVVTTDGERPPASRRAVEAPWA